MIGFVHHLKWLLVVVLFTGAVLQGHAQVEVGQWRGHLSYRLIHDVTGSDQRIFAAAPNGLLLYHKAFNNPQTLDKVGKLSDVGISAVAYSSLNEALLIGYRNGNLDVWREGEVSNYPALKNHRLYPRKRIHDVAFEKNRAFLACSFGVAVFDMETRDFRETFRLVPGESIAVYSVDQAGGVIYAATERGLFFAPVDAPNLDDPGRWERLDNYPDFGKEIVSVRRLQDAVLFVADISEDRQVLYHLTPSGQVNGMGEYRDVTLEKSADRLYVVAERKVEVYDANLNLQSSLEDYLQQPRPTALYADPQQGLWVGDSTSGLVHWQQQKAESIVYNGPWSDQVFALQSGKESVYGVHGFYGAGLDPGNVSGGWYRFAEEQWKNEISSKYSDFVDIREDPGHSGRVWVASWQDGLLAIEDGEGVNHYTPANSPLTSYHNGPTGVRNLCYDREGNLWLTNHQAEHPIKVLQGSGQWMVPEYDPLRNEEPGGMLCTENGYIWGFLHNTPLVFVVNTAGTWADPADDQVMIREVLNYNGKPFADRIYAMAADREGNIWIATDEGVAVDYDPLRFFEREDYRPNRIRLTIEGYTQYILRDNIVTDIAVDPANRKWFATRRAGIFVFSPQADRLVEHYTASQSPLLSDTTRSLAMNASGEVFMATASGICSYRSQAARGRENFKNAYVFPNPVRPGYEGKITITNLVEGVNVKITDISGNLVYETVAKGGQAVWDGKNFSGHRVASGVYLIFMTNEDGSKTHVGKLLFMK